MLMIIQCMKMAFALNATRRNKMKKETTCHGCGCLCFDLVQVDAFMLCSKCENSYRQVMDDLADEKSKEIYGVNYDR